MLPEPLSAAVTVRQRYFRKMSSLDTIWSRISFYFAFELLIVCSCKFLRQHFLPRLLKENTPAI